MIALWIAALLQVDARGVSSPPPPLPDRPAGNGMDAATLEALRRNPRELTRSPEGGPTDSGDPPPAMRTAVFAIAERDFPRALVDLYQVLDARPDYPPALYEMGVVYFRLQRYGDAVAVLERYLDVTPGAIGKTRVLGHCYYSLGDYARAKLHYERVLAVSERDAEAWRGLALSVMHLGDAKTALAHLDRVLELDPEHAEAWVWKADLLFESDRVEEALVAAEKARDLDQWEPRAWYLLGRILLELGREEQGLAAQSRYRELSAITEEVRSVENRLAYNPHQVPLLVRLVELHRSAANLPAVRRVLDRLTRERESDVELRVLALDVFEQFGDGVGARAAALALKECCSQDWRTWSRLEKFYGRLGERREQVEAGEKARRLRPR